MYSCNICDYFTDCRTAIYHHNKSKKHVINLEKDTLNKENEKLKLQEKEIAELKKELLIKDKEIEKLEAIKDLYKELSEKPKNVNNGIIINNNLSYVNKHFKNAPPLKKISNYTLGGIDLEDYSQIDKLAEKIIYSYNNKCLHKLIGDHLVENYKKDDIGDQSFHATDIARRKYLVKIEDNLGYLYNESSDEIDDYDPEKSDSDSSDYDDDEYEEMKQAYEKENKSKDKEIIKKKKSKWTNDSEGLKISYLLFEPLIRKIIRQLKKKCREYNEEIKKNVKKIPTKKDAERFEVLAGILKEIDKDKLKKNINNYIAPYFGLVKKT
jgi:hypothetical protein